MSNYNRVAILGCGPSGMFAAHAARKVGWRVDIFSVNRRSEMYGAQYLHEPIPGLETEARDIEYILRGGDSDMYRHKVYRGIQKDRVSEVSPQLLEGKARVWDIRAAYYLAWKMYNDRIIERAEPRLKPTDMITFPYEEYRAVFCSIPATALCYRRHQFFSQSVLAIGDAPERGVKAPEVDIEPDTVVCDASATVPWYRASDIFGYRTVEWPFNLGTRLLEVRSAGGNLVDKPISTNCDCYADRENFFRIGRYGLWQKGVLSHDAYYRVKEVLGV